MLAKKFRLPINSFPSRAGIFYRGKYFTIKTASNSLPYGRVGILLTKKTAARAVLRNRLRRKIFDLFGEVVENDGSRFRRDFGAPKDLLVLIKPIKLDRDAEENLLREVNSIKEKILK